MPLPNPDLNWILNGEPADASPHPAPVFPDAILGVTNRPLYQLLQNDTWLGETVAMIIEDYQLRSEKAQPLGYCPLDGNAYVPVAHIPPIIVRDTEIDTLIVSGINASFQSGGAGFTAIAQEVTNRNNAITAAITAQAVAVYGTQAHVFFQTAAPTSLMVEGDIWIGTTGVGHKYLSGSWVVVPASELPPIYGAIAQEAVVRASKDGQIEANWSVAVNAGGRITGIRLINNTGSPTAFIVDANIFKVVDSSGNYEQNPFTVTADGLVVNNAIITGRLQAAKIRGDSLFYSQGYENNYWPTGIEASGSGNYNFISPGSANPFRRWSDGATIQPGMAVAVFGSYFYGVGAGPAGFINSRFSKVNDNIIIATFTGKAQYTVSVWYRFVSYPYDSAEVNIWQPGGQFPQLYDAARPLNYGRIILCTMGTSGNIIKQSVDVPANKMVEFGFTHGDINVNYGGSDGVVNYAYYGIDILNY